MNNTKKLYAVVQLKGTTRSSETVRSNLRHMGLNFVNNLVFYREGDAVSHKVKEVENLVTYGEVSEEVFKSVFVGCTRKVADKLINNKEYADFNSLAQAYCADLSLFSASRTTAGAIRNSFCLHPPIGGLGRFGKTRKFKRGGCIGARPDISPLVLSMIPTKQYVQ
jgi:ribosomal protein L30/L7E